MRCEWSRKLPSQRVITLTTCAFVLAALILAGSGIDDAAAQERAAIVFVCEHGSVKSVMAAAMFEAMAKQEGLKLHAVARGVTPDEYVPPRIVAALRFEGIDVEGFRPQEIDNDELRNAPRVVAIGVDSNHLGDHVERWDDIPSSETYPAARDAIHRHLERLLDELRAQTAK